MEQVQEAIAASYAPFDPSTEDDHSDDELPQNDHEHSPADGTSPVGSSLGASHGHHPSPSAASPLADSPSVAAPAVAVPSVTSPAVASTPIAVRDPPLPALSSRREEKNFSPAQVRAIHALVGGYFTVCGFYDPCPCLFHCYWFPSLMTAQCVPETKWRIGHAI